MARPKVEGQLVIDEPMQQAQRLGVKENAMVTVWSSEHLKLNGSDLAGLKGPITPVPKWKMYENPFYEGILAAVQRRPSSGRDVAVSARRLAASLWGLQGHPKPSSSSFSVTLESNLEPSESLISPQQVLLSPPSPSCSNCSPVSANKSLAEQEVKSNDSAGQDPPTNGQMSSLRSHMHQLVDQHVENKGTQITSLSNDQLMGIEAQRRDLATSIEIKCLADGCLSPSKESFKVISRIRELEEQNTSSTSLAAALHAELDHSKTCVQELEVQHKAARKEIENLQRKILEERATWRTKEQESIRSAVQAAKEDVEEEKKLKRRIEFANKKLVKELADANAALSRMSQDLERERKAKETLETVCDDLARKIAEDKAELEELKRSAAKFREEVEEERKMLQVAETWREERVQIKLAEAQRDIEDRAAALNTLKIELEDFLDCRRFEGGDDPKRRQDIRDAVSLSLAVEALQLENISLVPGGKDAESNCVRPGNQLQTYRVDTLANPDTDISQVDKDTAFSKGQKFRAKSSKHDGQTSAGLKKYEPQHKQLKRRTLKDSDYLQKGGTACESKDSEAEIFTYDNLYSKLNLDRSPTLSESDGHEIADMHAAVNGIQRMAEDYMSEKHTFEPDLQAESSNSVTVWRSNSLARETPLSNSEHSVPKQQGRDLGSFCSEGKVLVSSAQHPFNQSYGTALHKDSWVPYGRNPHIARAVKGSIEWSKNVRDGSIKTKLERQQGRLSWKVTK